MKHDFQEILAVEVAVNTNEATMTELNELQLVVVAGGVGEVVIA